jgi:hypothetical protein
MFCLHRSALSRIVTFTKPTRSSYAFNATGCSKTIHRSMWIRIITIYTCFMRSELQKIYEYIFNLCIQWRTILKCIEVLSRIVLHLPSLRDQVMHSMLRVVLKQYIEVC